MIKSRFLQKTLAVSSVCVMAFLMILAPVNSVYAAMSETQLYENAQNGVYFYKADDCVPTSNISAGSSYSPDEGGWYWDGQCAGLSAQYIQNLERDIDAIKAAATQAGVPWELIPAQAINESGWKSTVYENCNNPLGIKGSGCGEYARYNTVQDAYYAYTQTAVIKDVISTGLYADKPYSFLEYMQYGGKYSYAVCEPGYSFCVGVPNGTPTPHYVNSVSKNVCGIQKWAESKGIEISSETYANFVDPKIDSRIGGVNDGLTATKSDYCKKSSSGDWGEGGMRIANVAVELAWPNQEDDTCGLNHEYPSWSNSAGTKNACKKIAKPQFTEAKAATGDTYSDDTDCGHFVNVTIRYSGVDSTLTPYQVSWMAGIYKNAQNSPLWEEVTDIVDQNAANLMPGDVFHSHGCGHTFIYVGNIPSKTYGNVVAQASQGGHTGDLGGGVVFTRDVREGERKTGCVGDSFYHIYRFIGDGTPAENNDDKTEEGNE